MANFKKYTRYTNGIASKTRGGEDFLLLRKPLNLERTDTDTFVTITQDLTKRPDLIASKAYGDTRFWWAIMEYNNIMDPLFELRPGQTIRIPDKDRLIQAIQDIGT